LPLDRQARGGLSYLVHTHIYTYTHTCTHTYIYTYIHTHIYIHIYTHAYIGLKRIDMIVISVMTWVA
jgi:hypothetical protein